jgi:hypothetical protein
VEYLDIQVYQATVEFQEQVARLVFLVLAVDQALLANQVLPLLASLATAVILASLALQVIQASEQAELLVSQVLPPLVQVAIQVTVVFQEQAAIQASEHLALQVNQVHQHQEQAATQATVALLVILESALREPLANQELLPLA